MWRRRNAEKRKKQRRMGMRYAIDPMAPEHDGAQPAPLSERSIPTPVRRMIELARHASSRFVGAELSYGTLDRVSGADPGVLREPEAIEMDRRFSSIAWKGVTSPTAQPPPPPTSIGGDSVL